MHVCICVSGNELSVKYETFFNENSKVFHFFFEVYAGKPDWREFFFEILIDWLGLIFSAWVVISIKSRHV